MLLTLLLLAGIAHAESTVQPVDYARVLWPQITGKSSINSISCDADACTMTWTPKPGQTVAFEDKNAQRTAHRNRGVILLQKFRSGAATPAEKDELLEKLAALVLKQE